MIAVRGNVPLKDPVTMAKVLVIQTRIVSVVENSMFVQVFASIETFFRLSCIQNLLRPMDLNQVKSVHRGDVTSWY